jgi:hypothetical protein
MNRIKEEILSLQLKIMKLELFSIHQKIRELERTLGREFKSETTCCMGFSFRRVDVK